MLRNRLTASLLVSATVCHSAGPCCQQNSMTGDVALQCSLRHKASSIKIANRRKVEMFVGKRFHLPTRLRTAAPDVAREWNYEKNPMHLYPEIIGIGHVAPVWWRCEDCGHEYEMSVEKRVVRGARCPACVAEEVQQSALSNTREEKTQSVADGSTPQLRDEDLLEGEANATLRPKRPTMLNLRTKY